MGKCQFGQEIQVCDSISGTENRSTRKRTALPRTRRPTWPWPSTTTAGAPPPNHEWQTWGGPAHPSKDVTKNLYNISFVHHWSQYIIYQKLLSREYGTWTTQYQYDDSYCWRCLNIDSGEVEILCDAESYLSVGVDQVNGVEGNHHAQDIGNTLKLPHLVL